MISAELKVGPKTIGTEFHNRLELNSYTRMPKLFLTDSIKARMLEMCEKVLSHLKNHQSIVKINSEKIVCVLSHQNTLEYFTVSTSDVKGTFKTKHSAWAWL